MKPKGPGFETLMCKERLVQGNTPYGSLFKQLMSKMVIKLPSVENVSVFGCQMTTICDTLGLLWNPVQIQIKAWLKMVRNYFRYD